MELENSNVLQNQITNSIEILVIVGELCNEAHFIDGHDGFFIIKDGIDGFLKFRLFLFLYFRQDVIQVNFLNALGYRGHIGNTFAQLFKIFVG